MLERLTKLSNILYYMDCLHLFRRTTTKEINSDKLFFVKGRSSRPEVFYKKGVLKNFAKCTKRTVQSPCFSGLQLYQKKILRHKCFLVNFSIFLGNKTPPVATSAKIIN